MSCVKITKKGTFFASAIPEQYKPNLGFEKQQEMYRKAMCSVADGVFEVTKCNPETFYNLLPELSNVYCVEGVNKKAQFYLTANGRVKTRYIPESEYSKKDEILKYVFLEELIAQLHQPRVKPNKKNRQESINSYFFVVENGKKVTLWNKVTSLYFHWQKAKNKSIKQSELHDIYVACHDALTQKLLKRPSNIPVNIWNGLRLFQLM